MGIVPSRTLGEIGDDNLLDKLSPLSLEETRTQYRNFVKKTAYYIRTVRGGERLFGLVGNSNLFYISNSVYEAIGSPAEDGEVSVSNILRAAGYG